MDVKEAVKRALHYTKDVFEGQEIKHLGLEEVEFFDSVKEWNITVGYFQDWDRNKQLISSLAFSYSPRNRIYKVVRIDDTTGNVLSIKNREVDT